MALLVAGLSTSAAAVHRTRDHLRRAATRTSGRIVSDARLNPRLHHRLGALLGGPRWRRMLLVRRTACVVLLVAALVTAVAPPPGSARAAVVVVAVDLAAGRTVRAADLPLRLWAPELVPAGAGADLPGGRGRGGGGGP